MNEQERKLQNEKKFIGMRKATACYIEQLRNEGLPEAEIQWRVEGANIEVARKMGVLSSGEDVPVEFYESLSALVKDVMKHGA